MSIDRRVLTARSSAHGLAKQKGIFFDLPTSADLPEIPKQCPICFQTMESGGNRNNSASFDRLLPNLGYTLQNIWWICHDCNRRKADLDPARAYTLWDRVWEEIKRRGLPLPATRLHPSMPVRGGSLPMRPDRISADEGEQPSSCLDNPNKQGE